MPTKHFKTKIKEMEKLSKISTSNDGGGFFLGLLRFLLKFLSFFFYFALGCFFLVVLLLLSVLPAVKDIYTVYSFADEGRQALTDGIFNAKEENYKVAENNFRQAYENFVDARNSLNNLYFADWPLFKDYFFVGDRFLRVAEQVSLGALGADGYFNEVYSDYEDYQQLSFNEIPLEARRKILAKLVESPRVLRSLKRNLNLSLLYLDQIESVELFNFWDSYLLDIKNKISKANELLNFVESMARIFPQLAAYPDERTYLVLLQNNHELRPTGGFIGTYGILKVHNAEIKEFTTKDVYSLDNEAGYYGFDQRPPWQLEEYLKIGQYYFRDANWRPDFKEAAEDLIWFYQAENERINGQRPSIDGVIAITPSLVTGFIDFFGGIEVDGDLYNSENFMELLEYKVEVDWHQQGLEVEQRKDVVGKIANHLKEKILGLSLDNLRPLIYMVLDSFETKDVLLYDTDPMVMDVYESNNWAGRLVESDSDYLMVVDANLASLKTDEVMERRLSYRIEELDGALQATANVYYENQGEEDWKHTTLKSYTRFYLPENIELLSSNGAGDIESIKEFGKLALGTYIQVPPGKSHNLQMTYKLPDEIYQQYKNGDYCLYVQKQPGTVNELVLTLPILNEEYRFMTEDEIVDPVLVDDKYIIYDELDKDFWGCLVKE